jgi:peptidoglycan/LPS O-acetylase OafA/YrhL
VPCVIGPAARTSRGGDHDVCSGPVQRPSDVTSGRFAYMPTHGPVHAPALAPAHAPAPPQASTHAPAPPARASVPVERLHYVDGLRGLAALAVALFHLLCLTERLPRALPAPIEWVLSRGYLGVNVFFVLSGFVMMHSLREARVSLPFLGRFVVRRSLRLDPPYWATIAIVAVAIVWHPERWGMRLSAQSVLSHLFYLQGVLGQRSFLDVFWTLCLEVQLYVVFVLVCWGCQSYAQASPTHVDRGPVRLRAMLLLTAGASAALALGQGDLPWSSTLLPWWYMFALGALACGARGAREDGETRAAFFLLLLAIAVRAAALSAIGPAVAVATALFLDGAGRYAAVGAALGGRVLRYLGKISYSFYLLHAFVGGVVMKYGLRTAEPTALRELLWLIVGLAASVLAGHLLWWSVERPSMAMSRRVRMRAAAEEKR